MAPRLWKQLFRHVVWVDSNDSGTRATWAEPELQNDAEATRAEPKLRNDGRLVII